MPTDWDERVILQIQNDCMIHAAILVGVTLPTDWDERVILQIHNNCMILAAILVGVTCRQTGTRGSFCRNRMIP